MVNICLLGDNCMQTWANISRGISHMDTILTDKIYLNVDDEMYLGLESSMKMRCRSHHVDDTNMFMEQVFLHCKLLPWLPVLMK